MSSDVLFVLFDANIVSLFHECSSLLRKNLFIYLFIHKNRSDLKKKNKKKVFYKSKIFIIIRIQFILHSNQKQIFLLRSKKDLIFF